MRELCGGASNVLRSAVALGYGGGYRPLIRSRIYTGAPHAPRYWLVCDGGFLSVCASG